MSQLGLGFPSPAATAAAPNFIPQTAAPPGACVGAVRDKKPKRVRGFRKRTQAPAESAATNSAAVVTTASAAAPGAARQAAEDAEAISVVVSSPVARTTEEQKQDEAFKVRLPWDKRTEEEEEEHVAKIKTLPKAQAPTEPDIDDSGKLMPPLANSDLPRALERDNSFMVLNDDNDLAAAAAAAEATAAGVGSHRWSSEEPSTSEEDG